jgi:hypothetical protein
MQFNVKTRTRMTVILSFCLTTSFAVAQSNPASVSYVNKAIAAATTLTSADWQAVCQSGDINSSNGCYGDAGSEAFAKINKLGGNPMGYAGVTGSAANSVWIRQVGVGTNCTSIGKRLMVKNAQMAANSTIWICGTALTLGSPVNFAYSLGALTTQNTYNPTSTPAGIAFTTIGLGNMGAGTAESLTANELYMNSSTVLPTVYVFCISTNSSSVATAFQPQVPQTFFQNEAVC